MQVKILLYEPFVSVNWLDKKLDLSHSHAESTYRFTTASPKWTAKKYEVLDFLLPSAKLRDICIQYITLSGEGGYLATFGSLKELCCSLAGYNSKIIVRKKI